ncbi:hypothetical protein HanXRQr2_Chr04g0187231 [Helianthus annuus]|uniref:Uncharacterized protein n=1 Tax=Helianthus annuus TaxID=4232 RepID=A0A9K3JBD9_HELAN|nr:hypothetical protein HanXRQr2_Chr04g0187231 [Helianthus annuus]KAJ0590828.1 hypothetical protein HanIR_Chr04g0201791 [Helianthus annuus]
MVRVHVFSSRTIACSFSWILHLYSCVLTRIATQSTLIDEEFKNPVRVD